MEQALLRCGAVPGRRPAHGWPSSAAGQLRWHALGLCASSGSSQYSLCPRESLAKARSEAQGSLQGVSISDVAHSATFSALGLRFISRLPVSSVQKCKMECAWPCTDAGIYTNSSKEGQSDSG